MSNIIDKLCEAALLEQSFIEMAEKKREKRMAKKGGIARNTLVSPENHYHVINLLDEPISYKTFTALDPMVCTTFGKYTITYYDRNHPRVKNDNSGQFVMGQDLIRTSLRFFGYRDFYKQSKYVVELGWLQRNTTISEELFELARRHAGTPFIFTIKFVEYARMIEEKAKERGIDTYTEPPFVTRSCSPEEWKEKYKDLKISGPRHWQAYRNDLKKMEIEQDEQDEEH